MARVSDDLVNGVAPRRTPITPAQVSRWVDYQNQAYAGADVQFLFIEDAAGPDFRDLPSSLLNTLTGEDHPQWTQQRTTGNSLARVGKMQVYSRFGGPNTTSVSTGGGFSSSSYNFIAMPGFNNTWLCGVNQNIGTLAHEAGHYFGLNHTFPRTFDHVNDPTHQAESAQPWFISTGNRVSAFDGDGLSDTPPDPFIFDLQCGAATTVTLNGHTINLPRQNLMSYWPAPPNGIHNLFAQQITIVRQTIANRGLDF